MTVVGLRPGPATRTDQPASVRRVREAALAVAGSVVVAAVMTWPVLRHPASTVPQDLVDPLYFVWQIAWTGHALRDGAPWWTTNAFDGAHGNLAYTDAVLGYAPVAALGQGTHGALLTYNLLYVGAVALAILGAYLLARVLGARPAGAAVAAAAFAFAPHRLAHARHLNVLSTGGIVLALALLARGHGWRLRRDDGGPRPARPGWILAGWAVACWQLTLGFAVGLPFAYALAGVLVVAAVVRVVRGRGLPRRSVLAADAVGALAFGVVGLALTRPYTRVVETFEVARRTEEMLQRYSPPVRGLFTAPPESLWWGGLQEGWRTGMGAVAEQTLLPGLVVLVLAVAGLRWSIWTPLARAGLAGTAVVVTLLALGTSAPGGGRWTYVVLFRHVPGWEALRTPGRLMLWVSLCLGLLAAGTVCHATAAAPGWWRRRRGTRAPRWLAAVAVVPAVLVLAEGAGAVAQPRVPRSPVALDSLAGPVLVLPTGQQVDFTVMTWSADGWPRLANGGSGFESPDRSQLRQAARAFPDADAIIRLRGRGVRTVVLARELAAGTPWAGLAARPVGAAPVAPGARILRDDADVVVYDLAGSGTMGG